MPVSAPVQLICQVNNAKSIHVFDRLLTELGIDVLDKGKLCSIHKELFGDNNCSAYTVILYCKPWKRVTVYKIP